MLISALAPKEYLQVIESRRLVALVADVDPERLLLSSNSVQRQLASGAKAIVLYYSLGSMPMGDDIFQLGVPVIAEIPKISSFSDTYNEKINLVKIAFGISLVFFIYGVVGWFKFTGKL